MNKVYPLALLLICNISIVKAEIVNNINFDIYGFLKSSYITASQKTESYGSNGFAAITQAAIIDETNAATKNADEKSRFGLQAQQSRLGFKIKHKSTLSGKIELDFVDFGAIAPSPDYDVRIRLAMIDWKLSEALSLQAGQKWVSVMGVIPHTYNYVQSNFYSGNTGFISQEMAFNYSTNSLSFTGAISSKGRNQGGAGVTENERGFLPALTIRLDYNHKNGIIGMAYMGANLEGESDPTNTTNTFHDGKAFIAKVFTSYKNSLLDFRAEYFIGQNTGDLFMLATENAIFTPSTGSNINVSGGFTSVKFNLSKKNALYTGYGMVKTKDGEQYVATNTMIANKVITFGLDRKTDSGLLTFLEFQNLDTKYHAGGQTKKSYDAFTIETGIVYKF